MAYYKTALESRFNAHGLHFAEAFGVAPENSAAVNTTKEKAMRGKLQGQAAKVLFKAGTYKFAEPIHRSGDYLTYEGVRGAGWDGPTTTLLFEAGTDGMVLENCPCEALRNIRLRGTDHNKEKGEGAAIGLTLRGLSNTWGAAVSGFGKLGVLIEGDLGVNGFNSSGTRHDNLWVAANWAGVRVQGMDANAISFYGADIRDHVGYGYEDDSLLGTNLFGCMFHANWAGHIRITSVNAPTGLFGVYEENEQNPSQYSALTGRWGGYSYGTTGGFVQKGVYASQMELDEIGLNRAVQLRNDYGGHWNVVKNAAGVWEFNLSNIHATRVYLLRSGDPYPGKADGALGFGWEYPERFRPLY